MRSVAGKQLPGASCQLPVVSLRMARLDFANRVGLGPTAYDKSMDFQFTAVFRRVPEGYIAFFEELPGANTQGVTLDEARTNLHEAVALVLEANRTLAQEAASDRGGCCGRGARL